MINNTKQMNNNTDQMDFYNIINIYILFEYMDYNDIISLSLTNKYFNNIKNNPIIREIFYKLPKKFNFGNCEAIINYNNENKEYATYFHPDMSDFHLDMLDFKTYPKKIANYDFIYLILDNNKIIFSVAYTNYITYEHNGDWDGEWDGIESQYLDPVSNSCIIEEKLAFCSDDKYLYKLNQLFFAIINDHSLIIEYIKTLYNFKESRFQHLYDKIINNKCGINNVTCQDKKKWCHCKYEAYNYWEKYYIYDEINDSYNNDITIIIKTKGNNPYYKKHNILYKNVNTKLINDPNITKYYYYN